MNIDKDILYFDLPKMKKKEAIKLAGEKLLEHGLIDPEYIDSMLEKEKTDQTYIGNKVAIPHGTLEGKKYVKKSGIVILHFRDSIDYSGNDVNVIIGIAGLDGDHLEILSEIAIKLSSEEKVNNLINAGSPEEFIDIFKN
ncbi:PTS sugar transporter subunit IIA [Tissierella sp. MSJ-40]|uniref:Mannitol-specific phosphotransferase enzyme IIA component n=1 Tax=Tissierella simiarum TaxID=2841534 RepID=A0ABS6E803_9FIRM|nr:PTS sugar transporter subunit IIA [Tissierella simiarum]MBU5438384.1 PTS sugar transporter subunit IIA [Tissierella simiarum]